MAGFAMLPNSVLLLAQAAAQDSSSEYALWGVVLLGLALVLFFLELFVPSGGVIGLGAALAMVAGIVMLFKFDTTTGLVGATVSLGAVPFLFMLGLKIWPHTPIGKMLTLGGGTEGADEADAATSKPSATSSELIGKTGEAITDLRPVGTCVIDGIRRDCLAEGGVIERGATIRVTSSDGMGIKVRADGDRA